jgi:hypothetical protein
MIITIRILRISTFILWAVILFFGVTAAYSVINLSINVGEFQMLPSGSGISFSLPFSIDNGGFYDITNLNLTTKVTDINGTLIDLTETLVPSIPRGSIVNSSHTISVELDEITSLDHVDLLLKDSDFNVQIFSALNFARAVPVELSLNTSIPWGAPFSNLNVGELSISSINSTHEIAEIAVSFENHAPIDIIGTLTLEIYNDSDERITNGVSTIDVPPGSNYSDQISMITAHEDLLKISNSGNLHLIFETPLFSVDWWEPYG